jgi:hypothetical protein
VIPKRSWHRAAVGGLAVAVAAVAVAGTAGARPAKTKPNPLPALIAKSKTESGLVVYGNPPAANFNALVAKFNAVYPWIKVTEYDLDDNTIFSKYASEAGQGARTADMLIASAPNLWIYASRQKYAMNYTPLGLDKYPLFVKQFKGIYVMSPDPAIIVYNKLLLKDKVPTSPMTRRRIPSSPATRSTTPSATPASGATSRRRAGRTSRRSASGSRRRRALRRSCSSSARAAPSPPT